MTIRIGFPNLRMRNLFIVHMEARFASPVLPGDALTVSMWETGAGEALFSTSVGDRVVIDQGLCRYAS